VEGANHLKAIEQAMEIKWVVHVIDDKYSKEADY
jgi:hypothetical protein